MTVLLNETRVHETRGWLLIFFYLLLSQYLSSASRLLHLTDSSSVGYCQQHLPSLRYQRYGPLHHAYCRLPQSHNSTTVQPNVCRVNAYFGFQCQVLVLPQMFNQLAEYGSYLPKTESSHPTTQRGQFTLEAPGAANTFSVLIVDVFRLIFIPKQS